MDGAALVQMLSRTDDEARFYEPEILQQLSMQVRRGLLCPLPLPLRRLPLCCCRAAPR